MITAYLKSLFGHQAPRNPLAVLAREGTIRLEVEIEKEVDGRWIADIPELPGVMVYGQSQSDAIAKASALALRVLADRIEHDAPKPATEINISFTNRECLAGH